MILKKDKKVLLVNFFSLSTLNFINYLLPLIILPYLIKVIGIENFGLINFALSVIMFFNILIGFGFDLSATRQVSIYKNDIRKVSEIFSSVYLIKAFLLILSFIVLCVFIIFVPKIHTYSMLFILTSFILIGNMFFPSWLYQGMEDMKYITIINVGIKFFFVLTIFLFIKSPSDYLLVPTFNSIGSILGGFVAFLYAIKKFNVKLIKPSFNEIKKLFVDSFHFFMSRIANNGMRYIALTLIGFNFNNNIIGLYSLAEKLFFAFAGLGGIVSQTIYPYMSRTRNILFFKKILLIISIILIIIMILLFFFSKYIFVYIFHIKNELIISLFQIMLIGIVIAVYNALIGYPLLAAFGYVKEANYTLVAASIFYIVFLIYATSILKNIYFVAFSLIAYELLVLLFRGYFVKKYKILRNYYGS